MTQRPFCIHPFVRQFVAPNGSAEVCCEATRHRPEHETITDDWWAPHLQAARTQWLKGEWPKECLHCKQIEAKGGKSLRQNTNDAWSHLLTHYQQHGSAKPPPPRAYDLRFSTHCNLACVMCYPGASSLHESLTNRWLGYDIKRSASYDLRTVKYICENAKHVENLWFAGGEPMLMPAVKKVIRHMVDTGHAQHIDLLFTTNNTQLRRDWLPEWLMHFRTVDFQVSCDGVGDRLEYVRWPIQWPQFRDNTQQLLTWSQQHAHITVSLAVTVHAANMMTMPELWQWHTDIGLDADYDVVWDPRWMNIGRMPQPLRDDMITWIDSLNPMHAHHTRIFQNVRPHLAQGFDYSSDEEHNTVHVEQLRHINYLNSHRPLPWSQAVPELADWEQGCQDVSRTYLW